MQPTKGHYGMPTVNQPHRSKDFFTNWVQSHKSRYFRWIFWGILILNLSLAISYIGLWAIQAQKGNLWQADFTAFYTGWAIVRDGKGSLLYNLNLEMSYQQDILDGRSFFEGLLPFINPPHVGIIFAPLACLPLSHAYTVWTLFQVGLLLWLFVLLNQLADDWAPAERNLLLITSAALPSMLINFLLGAFSLLMLVCILQFVLALRRSRPISRTNCRIHTS